MENQANVDVDVDIRRNMDCAESESGSSGEVVEEVVRVLRGRVSTTGCCSALGYGSRQAVVEHG